MKTAKAWTEQVSYWECPYCGHCHDAGADSIWDDETVMSCEKCGKESNVECPEEK
jgi:hypothetical protein